MAEKINDPANETGTKIEGEALTPVQEEALSQGWVPKEEFDGDAERWVDAGEFIRRGELFRKIESQSKELKDVKKALAELAKHNSRIREVEYQRAVEGLKAQKKNALAEGDADRVVEIDDKLDLVKDQQRQFTNQQIQEAIPQEVHPELKNWVEKNSWYESNRSMKAWADARGMELAEEGKSPREVLKTLETEVKTRFKEKFSNPNRERAGAVEGVTSRPAKGASAEYELTDTERTIMNTLVAQKVLTKEEYIAQLKAVKERN
jgi:hypothetical protein